MNYFLDTNIIIILFEGRKDEIRNNVREILMNEELLWHIILDNTL